MIEDGGFIIRTLIKTKLLEGKYLELREYELFKEPLKVIHCSAIDYKFCSHTKCPFMFLSVAQQKKGKVVNTQQSKFPPYKYYRMYKYLWKTSKINADVTPGIDISVRSRLADEFFKKHPELRRHNHA